MTTRFTKAILSIRRFPLGFGLAHERPHRLLLVRAASVEPGLAQLGAGRPSARLLPRPPGLLQRLRLRHLRSGHQEQRQSRQQQQQQ